MAKRSLARARPRARARAGILATERASERKIDPERERERRVDFFSNERAFTLRSSERERGAFKKIIVVQQYLTDDSQHITRSLSPGKLLNWLILKEKQVRSISLIQANVRPKRSWTALKFQ